MAQAGLILVIFLLHSPSAGIAGAYYYTQLLNLIFFVFGGMGFELRVLHLLHRYSTT
jgi:hypothetical protein